MATKIPSPRQRTRAARSSENQGAGITPSKSTRSVAVAEPDLDEALILAMQMMALPGVTGSEGLVAEFIVDQLRRAGAVESAIQFDSAHARSPQGGEVGNLIFKVPGAAGRPRRLLMAHMDTVPICVGSQPVIDGNYVRSANPQSGLGADDRAGAAAVLCAALAILRNELPHPPLTFFWPIQEEGALDGVHYADVKLLGKPKLAFNWDGGSPATATIGATGGYRMRIGVEGLASHAGIAPEAGVSAIAIASLAIARLVEQGWHGQILKGKRQGTSNVGHIQGGGATNVVTDDVQLFAEVRSHDPKFRKQIAHAFERAFQQAAKQIRSSGGKRGTVTVAGRLDYESFRLNDDEPCVAAAEAAIRSVGLTPVRTISNGGLDANWMKVHGIPTVTLGCGQIDPHTVSERLDIAAFHQSCRIALRLATTADGKV